MGTTVGFRFLAGRYHATPWETHVNEAAVEWPPSPWRILRALIAVWYRKTDPGEIPQEALRGIVDALASSPPHFLLPPTTRGHARHYMPIRKGGRETTTLIFDAFLRLDPDDELVVSWPEVGLRDEHRRVLAILLERIGYLGRAESWVEARLIEGWDGTANCVPLPDDGQRETDTDEAAVHVLLPQRPERYRDWRTEEVTTRGLDATRLSAAEKRVLGTLPSELFGALRLESADVRREGWSSHPGTVWCRYRRPLQLSTVGKPVARRAGSSPTGATTVRLALHGKPLPRIEDAIKVGEAVRATAMKEADRITERDGDIPPVLSGHGMGSNNGHAHAFYLPDANTDGRIDHVIVHAEGQLDGLSVHALSRVNPIWVERGLEWSVAIEQYGDVSDFVENPMLGSSTVWVSRTPYLHPWHRKRSFTIEDQIRRECRERSLPQPEVLRLPWIAVHGRKRRPAHFYRFRTRGRRRAAQPDTAGSFWRLTFPRPVRGPLALGFACHFGLGMFACADQGTGSERRPYRD